MQKRVEKRHAGGDDDRDGDGDDGDDDDEVVIAVMSWSGTMVMMPNTKGHVMGMVFCCIAISQCACSRMFSSVVGT
jgi:hypothetical protein